MHKILEKLLNKRGVDDPQKLSTEEKQTFDGWQRVLDKEELTMDDMRKFCQSQIEVIETRWKDLSVKNEDKSELIPYHTVYKTILLAIDAPKDMRSALETQLNQMLQQ